MRLDDLATDGQPQTGTVLATGREGIEKAISQSWVDSGSIVTNVDLRRRALGSSHYVDASGSGLGRVREQVREDLPESSRVGGHAEVR